MQEFEEDFYAILGVEETATTEEIRKAYLRLAKKLHPDRFPNDAEKRSVAQTEFAKVTRAYDIVSDAESRAEYDTLRALTRKRAQPAPEVEDGKEPAAAAADSTAVPLTRTQQAQTRVDDENINVKWANKHLTRADELYRKKRYQEAETSMKEAIRLVPGDPKYRNKLAEIYLARGWKTLAMTEVQAALRIDARDPVAKSLEAKVKAAIKTQGSSQSIAKGKANFIEQIKSFFSGKKR
jgi:curved DNA-binding protein CbpA